jgi:gluconate kinase
MAARQGHFMPTALLDNQFATLQEPSPDEHAIVVDIGGTPFQIVAEIMQRLAEWQGALTAVGQGR